MCVTFHQIPVHSPSVFRLMMKRKRKIGITQPFYLYTIHEHSMMHMIHELRTFVDSRTSQMPKSHNWHKFITWSGMFLSIKKTTLQSVLTWAVRLLHSFNSMNPLVTIGSVTLFLSVFTRAFTLTFLYPLSISLGLSQTSAFFGYCFL